MSVLGRWREKDYQFKIALISILTELQSKPEINETLPQEQSKAISMAQRVTALPDTPDDLSPTHFQEDPLVGWSLTLDRCPLTSTHMCTHTYEKENLEI